MLRKSRIILGSTLSRYVGLSCNESISSTNNIDFVGRDRVCLKSYSQNAPRARLENGKDLLPVNKFVERTHTCGELDTKNIGEKVHLCGWMEFHRMGKFVILRDAYGSTQLIIPDEDKEISEELKNLSYESVLSVTGRVVPRPPGQENKRMKTGFIEIHVESAQVLNKSKAQLPFNIRNYHIAKESIQMQYRYLSLRFPEVQKNLRMRSRVTSKMREYLVDHCGFIDVETPTLFRRTPGGAQEFVVPTQHPGQFYSLVQSPQQFKQLLMVGGIDRYFQIARCYRDEGARIDRQPEFTQLDIEMSFSDREGVMSLVEGLLTHCWPADELGSIKLPIRRMNFEDVYETYGSEQPDLRIPYRIYNITELFNETSSEDDRAYALSFPASQSHLTTSAKKKLDDIRDTNFSTVHFVQMKITGDTWKTKVQKLLVRGRVEDLERKLDLKDGDVLFIVRGKKHNARKLLGKIRVEFANIMERKDSRVRSSSYEFLWVVDFPLFYRDDDDKKMSSTHHPFTQPHPEDIAHLETDPLTVRGLHYDLVLNGSEIAGGSIRIHDANLQERILNMLEIDATQMKHLIEGLASGAPPHGGIAFGLDRLISIICGTPNIRSVIAFPKTMEGRDLMSGAPVKISEEEKRLYHLSTLDETVQS